MQHEKSAQKVQHENNATWKECNTENGAISKEYKTKKVQLEKSAIWKSITRKKCNTKWVQHEAKRVKHWKKGEIFKKVHKNSALESTNSALERIMGRPLTDRYTLVVKSVVN